MHIQNEKVRQAGFTLLEVLVMLAVGGVLIVGALAGTQQVMLGTNRNNNQVVALTDAHQAALVIKKDLLRTQNTDLVDGDPVPRNSANLTWIDYTYFETGNWTAHSSSYALTGTELQRNYDGADAIIGRNITYVGFTQSGRTINVTITATGSGAQERSETLEFSVYIRAEEVE
jgi:prepilin-type N-terminal cleavage/methylation domain-containing protein